MDNPSQVEQIGASVAVYGTIYAAVLLYSAAQLLRLWPELPAPPSEPSARTGSPAHSPYPSATTLDRDVADARMPAESPLAPDSRSTKAFYINDLHNAAVARTETTAAVVEQTQGATKSLAVVARRRSAWRLEWAAYIALCFHTAAAFHFHHDWSHARAVAATARQTEEILGLGFGGGIFFNYAVLILWPLALALPGAPLTNGRRCCSRFVTIVNVYVAFLFFQGVVVFGQGMVRIWGLLVTFAVVLLLPTRRRKPLRPQQNRLDLDE
ncbi:MAG TPA: hypothetical protein PLV92_02070 [Pirellulaceae bacterium]|nr:hypothetical protein [Pirellulaceae bacterium]